MSPFTIYRLLYFLFILQFTQPAFSQGGHDYLINYSLQMRNIDKRITGMTQDTSGIMYYTTTNGIMSYDGSLWNIIKTPSTPHCINSNTKKEVLYVGCEGDFGYLGTNNNGYNQYHSVVDSDIQFGKITKIIVQDNLVYFYSKKAIFLYSKKSKSVKKIWKVKTRKHFTGIFLFKNKVYVNRKGNGLNRIINEKFIPVKNGMDMSDCEILADIPLDAKRILLYTNNSEGFIFNGDSFKKQKNDIINYIQENTLTCGLNISEDKYIIGTLTGGCMLIDKKENDSISVINYQTGLPDDEIFSLGKDNCNGIWIAHELGVSRLDTKLPIKHYSSYPGIKGHINSSKILDNKNYVATNQGLFVLSELSVNEKKIYIKGKKKPKSISDTSAAVSTDLNSSTNYDSPEVIKNEKLKNLFQKYKNIKYNEAGIVVNEDTNLITPTNAKFYANQQLKVGYHLQFSPYEKRSITSYYVKHSIVHGYKKIEGIEDKCKDMVLFNNNVLALGATTLYKVKKGNAIPIIKNKVMNAIYVSRENENTFYIGTSKGIFAHNLHKELWSLENIFAGVHSILEDDDSNIWVGCEKFVMKIEIDENGFPGRQTTYHLNIGFSEKIISRIISGNIYFFSSSKIFMYADEYNEIIEIDNLMGIEINDYLKVIYSTDDLTWVNDGSKWTGLSKNKNQDNKDIKYLNVLNGVQNIYLDLQNKAWVIDGYNNLYRIDTDKIIYNDNSVVLTMRSINNSKNLLLPLYDVALNYDHSGVEFNFSTPSFINEKNIEYQYLLEGEMDDWSKWNTSSFVHFPFVPIGKYNLKVRSRNVFDIVSNEVSVPLTIIPPYWLKSWFYIMEIVIIFTLLLISILINSKKEENWISKSLMLLSVVIVFKLLQVISHSYIHTNPVLDFIISVIMVFAILKIEKIAVKWLIKMSKKLKTRRIK